MLRTYSSVPCDYDYRFCVFLSNSQRDHDLDQIDHEIDEIDHEIDQIDRYLDRIGHDLDQIDHERQVR